MYLVSRAVWSILAAVGCLEGIVNAATDVLDIGVVFPRQNETYAPTERFPIILALQNAQLATYLKPVIDVEVLNGSMTALDKVAGKKFDLEWVNYTDHASEPYLLYAFRDFRIEGPLKLLFQAWWMMCNGSGEDVYITTNHTQRTTLWVDFEIREGGQTADLVAATAEEEECPAHVGVAINVTGETHDVPVSNQGNRRLHGLCAVVDSSPTTPDSNPCSVKIGEAALQSIEAEDLDWRCKHQMWIPVDGCPEEDNALRLVAVTGGATLAVVLAAIAFLLV